MLHLTQFASKYMLLLVAALALICWWLSLTFFRIYLLLSLRDIGEHMRTIRLFTVKSTGPDSVEVSQLFGAINTRTGQVDREAVAMRDQVFSELEDPNWKWANRATEILSK